MDATNSPLIDRICGEYREMPGLSLTVPQACRLWQLDRATCEAVFTRLVAEDVLRKTRDGAYIALPSPPRSLKAHLHGEPTARRIA